VLPDPHIFVHIFWLVHLLWMLSV